MWACQCGQRMKEEEDALGLGWHGTSGGGASRVECVCVDRQMCGPAYVWSGICMVQYVCGPVCVWSGICVVRYVCGPACVCVCVCMCVCVCVDRHMCGLAHNPAVGGGGRQPNLTWRSAVAVGNIQVMFFYRFSDRKVYKTGTLEWLLAWVVIPDIKFDPRQSIDHVEISLYLPEYCLEPIFSSISLIFHKFSLVFNVFCCFCLLLAAAGCC